MLRWLLPGLLGAALIAPSTAAAASGSDFIPPFRIAGTNGYQVEIYAEAEADDGVLGTGPTVFVSIWDHHSQTIYKTLGRVDADGYSADFDRLGTVDVHYEPRPSRPVEDCGGRRRSEPQVHLTGSVHFHGERHFTEVDYPYLDAGLVNQYEQICYRVGEGGRGANLYGLSRYTTTKAFSNGPHGRARFSAETTDLVGRTLVFRYLQVFGPAKTFVWSRRFASARITPPAPFHGSASFHVFPHKREYGRWHGNLTVDFPGAPRFPLATGPTLGSLKGGGCEVHAALRRVGPPILCL